MVDLERSSKTNLEEIIRRRGRHNHRYKGVVCALSARVMSSKKIVTKIKDALSRGSRSPSPEPGPLTGERTNINSPFTRFVLSNLDEQDHKMVANAFAPQIQTDCDAPVVDFDENYYLLGMEKKECSTGRDSCHQVRRISFAQH